MKFELVQGLLISSICAQIWQSEGFDPAKRRLRAAPAYPPIERVRPRRGYAPIPGIAAHPGRSATRRKEVNGAPRKGLQFNGDHHRRLASQHDARLTRRQEKVSDAPQGRVKNLGLSGRSFRSMHGKNGQIGRMHQRNGFKEKQGVWSLLGKQFVNEGQKHMASPGLGAVFPGQRKTDPPTVLPLPHSAQVGDDPLVPIRASQLRMFKDCYSGHCNGLPTHPDHNNMGLSLGMATNPQIGISGNQELPAAVGASGSSHPSSHAAESQAVQLPDPDNRPDGEPMTIHYSAHSEVQNPDHGGSLNGIDTATDQNPDISPTLEGAWDGFDEALKTDPALVLEKAADAAEAALISGLRGAPNMTTSLTGLEGATKTDPTAGLEPSPITAPITTYAAVPGPDPVPRPTAVPTTGPFAAVGGVPKVDPIPAIKAVSTTGPVRALRGVPKVDPIPAVKAVPLPDPRGPPMMDSVAGQEGLPKTDTIAGDQKANQITEPRTQAEGARDEGNLSAGT